jgi:hypothetical protein
MLQDETDGASTHNSTPLNDNTSNRPWAHAGVVEQDGAPEEIAATTPASTQHQTSQHNTCTSRDEKRFSWTALLVFTAITTLPVTLMFVCMCKPMNCLSLFMASFDFAGDLAIAIVFALRSKNMALEEQNRRFFLLMSILVYMFAGFQMLLSLSICLAHSIKRLGIGWGPDVFRDKMEDKDDKALMQVCSILIALLFLVLHIAFSCWALGMYGLNKSRNVHPALSMAVIIPIVAVAVCFVVTFFVVLPLWGPWWKFVKDDSEGCKLCTGMLVFFLGIVCIPPLHTSLSLALAFGLSNAEDALEIFQLVQNVLRKGCQEDHPKKSAHRAIVCIHCIEGVPVSIIQVASLLRTRKTCLSSSWLEWVSLASSCFNLLALLFMRFKGHNYETFLQSCCCGNRTRKTLKSNQLDQGSDVMNGSVVCKVGE